jgi:Dihaem cytochrome c
MKKLILCALVASVAIAGGYRLDKVTPAYQKECGSCHTAYQPEFLSKKAWDRVLAGQKEHFGDDLGMTTQKIEEIRSFLYSRAQDVSGGKIARKMSASPAKDANSIKISDNGYFIKEHRRISKADLDKKGLKSLANCTTCHKGADNGYYDED